MAHATSNLNINWLESLQTCLPHGQQWKVSYYSVSLPLKKINILCFSFLFFFFSVYVCACGALIDQKRASDSMDLSQMVMSHQAGTGSLAWATQKNSQCS